MGSFAALAYVGLRTSLRRLATVLRHPTQILVAIAIVAALALLFGLGRADVSGLETIAVSVGSVVLAIALLVAAALTLVVSSLRSPVRVRGPDVTWLFPSPGSGRGIVAYHLVVRLVTVSGIALVAATTSPLTGGGVGPRMVVSAYAFALLAGSLRAFSYNVYFLTQHGVPVWLLRLLAAATLGVPIAWFYATTPNSSPNLTGFLDVYGSALEFLIFLVQPAFAHVSTAPVGASLAALTTLWAVLAASAIALAWGYQDGTARTAYEQESMAAAVAGARPTEIAFGNTSLTSFDKLDRLKGDWAFAWRGVAEIRRGASQELASSAVLGVLSLAAALWLPGLAFILILLVIAGGVARGAIEGMADELTRSNLWTVPGAGLPRFVAVSAAPTLRLLVALTFVLVPLLFVGPYPREVVVGAAILALPVAALVSAANSLAALIVPALGLRIGLSALITSSGLALAGVALWQFESTAPAIAAAFTIGVVVLASVIALGATMTPLPGDHRVLRSETAEPTNASGPA